MTCWIGLRYARICNRLNTLCRTSPDRSFCTLHTGNSGDSITYTLANLRPKSGLAYMRKTIFNVPRATIRLHFVQEPYTTQHCTQNQTRDLPKFTAPHATFTGFVSNRCWTLASTWLKNPDYIAALLFVNSPNITDFRYFFPFPTLIFFDSRFWESV